MAYLAVAFVNTHASTASAQSLASKVAPFIPHDSAFVAVPKAKGRYTVRVTPAKPGSYGALVPTLVSDPAGGRRYVVGLSLRGTRPGRIGVAVDEFSPGVTSVYVLNTTVPATAKWHHYWFEVGVKGSWLGLGMYV